MKLPITYAGGRYDRMMALMDGTVRPSGIDLRYLAMPVEPIFWRMMRHLEFDASELSAASFSIATDRGDDDLVIIPVFPSRHFRLSCFYVRQDSPIERLEDLRGKNLGLPEYQMTAGVWARGLLSDHFSVPLDSVRWVTGRPERVPIDLPENVSVYKGKGGLEGGLLDGTIDAIFTARLPAAYTQAQGMRRLLRDSQREERSLFEKTGIFPIMHTVCIRSDVYKANRWIARSLFEAFEAAKSWAETYLYDSTALPVMLPWLVDAIEEQRAMSGGKLWSYGLSKENRNNIDTLQRYLFEQGLTKRKLSVDELFVPELLDS